MNYSGTLTTVSFMVILAALPGCNSKKNDVAKAPEQKTAQRQISSAHGQAKPQAAGAVVAPPKDEADAAALKARVLAQVKNRDFAAIYKDASEGFRNVGPEERFVALWNNQLLETGAYKEAKETTHTVRPTDRFLVFTYLVQYEKKKKGLTLTFGRSKDGKMELTGISQKELKQNQAGNGK
jgi:hypothetical protein